MVKDGDNQKDDSIKDHSNMYEESDTEVRGEETIETRDTLSVNNW